MMEVMKSLLTIPQIPPGLGVHYLQWPIRLDVVRVKVFIRCEFK
jgi:hypothetical protein